MRWGILHAVWVVVAMSNAAVTCIPIGEFDSMLYTLRITGYDLFCNAILTSDLQFHILSSSYHDHTHNHTHSFTFFAPTDASLFSLDMTQTAASYSQNLRFHIVPRRLSLADLSRLPDGYTLPTLLPQRRIHLTRRRSSPLISISGVDITFPGLFYGSHVAVRVLAGSLSPRSDHPPSLVPALSVAGNLHFSPRFSPVSSPENLGPVPFNFRSQRGSTSHPSIESPAPETSTQAPANGSTDAAPTHPPVILGDSPDVDSPPIYPESAISLPPEGYSGAAVPAPVGGEKDRVSLMEGDIEMESPAESEALDGLIRNCENQDVGIGLEDYMTHHHHVPQLHCFAT